MFAEVEPGNDSSLFDFEHFAPVTELAFVQVPIVVHFYLSTALNSVVVVRTIVNINAKFKSYKEFTSSEDKHSDTLPQIVRAHWCNQVSFTVCLKTDCNHISEITGLKL